MSHNLSFATLASAAIAAYTGRDNAFPARLQFWIEHFGDRLVTEIGPDDIEDGIDVLVAKKKVKVQTTRAGLVYLTGDKPITSSTVNRYIAALGSCFRILKTLRLLPRGMRGTRMPRITRLPEGEARTLTVTVEDVRRLVAVCRVSRNPRLAALVAVACTTGWRKGSFDALRWGDVDLHVGHIDTARTKNGTPHRAPLLPWVVAELARIRPTDPSPTAPVFGCRNITKAWQTALKRADLPEDWTFHHCRHIAASILAQSGASVPQIMATLNHKSPNMSLRYSHLNVASQRQCLATAWEGA